VRRAATWRPKRPGAEQLDVSQLISPLRYDVRVRADFFDFLAENEGHLGQHELSARAWESSYGEWFRSVAMPRFRPWVLKDETLTRASFDERVASAQALRASFLARGFDQGTPVTLRRGRVDALTETGIRTSRPLHVGDGGHRLALLLHAGLDLMPHMYRVDPRDVAPIDNTAVLLSQLTVPMSEYVRFLGHGYTEVTCTDLAQLRSTVAQTRPDLVTELDSVVAVHVPLIRG